MTAPVTPGDVGDTCDCDLCRGERATSPNERRIAALELELAHARAEIAQLEEDLAVAVHMAFRRGHVLRAIKPLVGVLPEPAVTG